MYPYMNGPFVSGADAQFLSGNPQFVSGPFVSGMANIAGQDPVSAMLGLEDIAGYGGYPDPSMMGFGLPRILNPIEHLKFAAHNLNPFGSGLAAKINPAMWAYHALHHGGSSGPAAPDAAQAAAINSKLIAHGAGVVPRHNQKARRYPCPLPATPVAGGASATISAQPQALYRPERLVIAASIAPSFSVTDIKVGNVSQIPNTGEIPGELFAQNGVDCSIELDTVNPALNLLVVVTNITGGTLTFRGAFIGTTVQ